MGSEFRHQERMPPITFHPFTNSYQNINHITDLRSCEGSGESRSRMAGIFLLSPSGDIRAAPVGIGREANPDLREPTFVSLLRIMMEQTAAETVPNQPIEPGAGSRGQGEGRENPGRRPAVHPSGFTLGRGQGGRHPQ